jgi:hypothetical protein
MARHPDPVVAEVKRIRRALSVRLARAHRAGRLHEEMAAVGREGLRAYRETIRELRNGHVRRKAGHID